MDRKWLMCSGHAALLATIVSLAAIYNPSAVAQGGPTAPGVRVIRDTRMNHSVWPVDLNRDGITDLVSSTAITFSNGVAGGGFVQVSTGKGDGTFNAPVQSSFRGFVIGAGDFNGDSRRDVVAESVPAPDGGTITIVILPGTGTATLGAPITVRSLNVEFVFAVTADFNGDGKRDLVLPGVNGVDILRGNGDFTFGTPVNLTTGFGPSDAIGADLNGDGKRDLVTANVDGQSLSVFLNQGSLMFTAADIPLGHPATDVVAADVNGDGHLDLVVSAGRPDELGSSGEGEVFVLLGTGTGAFGAPVEYPVLRGPVQIVAGDFNRDGIVDIATGNRSPIVRDDCADTWKTWDSVSILIGAGNGTFSGPSNFSIGDQSLVDPANPDSTRYRNTLSSLNTSDLNRDGAADLIAAQGAVLLNIAAVANRPPSVDAGPDTIVLNVHEVVLRPKGADPDQDVLTWEIRDETGRVVATFPNACVFLHDGDNTFTITVNDEHGHTASDTVVYTVRMTDGGVGSFAAGSDIGSVGAAGSESFDPATGTYTVKGSGADIWGTADEFRYVWASMHGDFAIQAFVTSVQNVHAWTKAGVMIRENLNPGARHASLFATPAKGLAFQRRTTENGISVHTAGPFTTAPVWLKLQRTGDVLTAYYRKSVTDFWTKIASETLAGFGSSPLVGLAVTSHSDGTLATASFSQVRIEGALPWTGSAIGSGSGSVATDGVIFDVTGRGADIWGTSDAFFYVHVGWSGELTLTARVRSITNTHAWAKAGLMFRENLTAGSKHVMVVVTPGKGVSMQYRPTPGGLSVQAANIPGTAPGWLRLIRLPDSSGGWRFTSFWSKDGVNWTTVGSIVIPFAFEFRFGLPVTSHNASATTSVAFDDVSIANNP